MNKLIFVFLVFLCGGAFAVPTVSDVVVRTRRPWSNLVDIHYVLTGADDAPIGLSVSLTANGTTRTLAESELTGAFRTVVSGAHRVTWNPGSSAVDLKAATLTLTPDPAKRTYMIVDLKASGSSAANVSFTNEVVGSGTQWDDAYKTNKLVLKYVPRGTFLMGADSSDPERNTSATPPDRHHRVTLTRGFYMAVYEMTLAQYRNLTGSEDTLAGIFPNAANREFFPVDRNPFGTYRGTTATGYWPTNGVGHTVSSSCVLGKLRTKTGGVYDFDIPTDAQWEYVCRAGSTAPRYGALADIARYYENGAATVVDASDYGNVTKWKKDISTDEGPAKVGSYQPNAWGFYDMIGNAAEWTLDLHRAAQVGDETVDPPGPIESDPFKNDGRGPLHCIRGGSWIDRSSFCRAACRTASNYHNWAALGYYSGTLRVVCPLDDERE